jgi:integrase/recombinase XerD
MKQACASKDMQLKEDIMNKKCLLGPWIRRFLLEHLVDERNLTYNTQTSYRDTFVLFLPFVAKNRNKSLDHLFIEDISSDILRQFLLHLEEKRGCSVSTRNQRLSAVHALARFVGERNPEHIAWLTQIRSIPFKKTSKPPMTYLEKHEMDALINAPNRNRPQGLRDHVMLLFLYNSGARASEAAHLAIEHLNLGNPPSVTLFGKGRKIRQCPLWTETASKLTFLIIGRDRDNKAPVFLNRCKQPITRFGIRYLVKRSVQIASQKLPGLSSKRITTHTIRTTAAVHLLRSGVDINTIRAWLGHVSLDTTHIYAEADLEMKAKALAQCEIPALASETNNKWSNNPKLINFLKSL